MLFSSYACWSYTVEEEGLQVYIYIYFLLCILAYFWFVLLRLVLTMHLQGTVVQIYYTQHIISSHIQITMPLGMLIQVMLEFITWHKQWQGYWSSQYSLMLSTAMSWTAAAVLLNEHPWADQAEYPWFASIRQCSSWQGFSSCAEFPLPVRDGGHWGHLTQPGSSKKFYSSN